MRGRERLSESAISNTSVRARTRMISTKRNDEAARPLEFYRTLYDTVFNRGRCGGVAGVGRAEVDVVVVVG